MTFRRTPTNATEGESAEEVRCPVCGSTDTKLERTRGPGLCRTVHYCTTCQQPFEEFS
ncbi:MAG: hypothetical protein ACQETB_06360 [Halobacteriota archaeon]